MTLRLYAQRKAWALGAVHVDVTWRREAGATPADVFDRVITLSGDLDADQRAVVALQEAHGASLAGLSATAPAASAAGRAAVASIATVAE